MNTQSAPPSAAALMRETEARMAQALDNFFQRSRSAIQAALVRSVSTVPSHSGAANGQLCLDWITLRPQALSTAFADQFRVHLTRPDSVPGFGERAADLQLMDEETFRRRLAEEKATHEIVEALRPDMLLLFGRLQALRKSAGAESRQADCYGPLHVVRALSDAFDALKIDRACGTLLLQSASTALRDTLRHTYTALNQFLSRNKIPEAAEDAELKPRRASEDAGSGILAQIDAAGAADTQSSAHLPERGLPPLLGLVDRLASRQSVAALTSQEAASRAILLRRLQHAVQETGVAAFDLAVLDAVAALFETMLDDAVVSPCYKAVLARLQIPILKVALSARDFFSDPRHPARQLLDMIGLFSRRFPAGATAHEAALAQIHAACAGTVTGPDPLQALAASYRLLSAWLATADARTADALGAEIAHCEDLERQALGTLLALENLQDLTERYPAPESVLRRLEAAWVPYMASLYRAEAGEGPNWRAACFTLLQLFLSLQAPDDDTTRETRLQSIPSVNAALRQGLLAQGACPAQLKDFFGAVTAAQERWIRPALSRPEAAVRPFSVQAPQHAGRQARVGDLALRARFDGASIEVGRLIEGDWVDFDPPYEGLATARVAWIGLGGSLLFSDGPGEQRFSLEREQLAEAFASGRAHIPERSLTAKALRDMKPRLTATIT